MSNRCIVFVTDNAALVSIINQQTSKHKLVMILIRDLVLTSLRNNIMSRARHIPGLNNTQADSLSRLQIARFRRSANSSAREPFAEKLVTNLESLLSSVLSSRSCQSYCRAWSLFREFHTKFYKTEILHLPLSTASLALFISFLDARKLSPATILSYLSAIGFVHKMKGLHDPTKAFIIQKLLTPSVAASHAT